MSVNFFLRSLLVAVLITASASAVSTTWNGSVGSDWATAGNWTSTLPVGGDTAVIPVVTSPAAYPVVAALAPATGAIIRSDIAAGASLGINSGGTLASTTTNNSGTLTVNSGGTMTGTYLNVASGGLLTIGGTVSLTNIGLGATGSVGSTATVNAGGALNIPGSSSATHTINAGSLNVKGTVTFNRTIYCGSGGSASVPRLGTINVTDGGVLNNASGQGNIILGNNTSGTRGVLNVWGTNSAVTLNSSCGLTIGRSPGTGLIDLRNGGRIEYGTNTRTPINNGITAGTVVAGDPREGLVITDIATNRWKLTTFARNQAFTPTPASPTANINSCTLVSLGTIPVSWMAPLERNADYVVEQKVYSNFSTGTVAVDVNGWPTDPNGDNLTLMPQTYARTIGTAAALRTLPTMTSAVGGIYQWRVDSIDNSKTHEQDPNYPITTKGTCWYFRTGNSAPVAAAGPKDQAGNVIPQAVSQAITSTWTSNATITDDGLPQNAAVTGTWTQVNGPVTVIAPAGISVTKANPNITLSLTTVGRYQFQLVPYDTALYGTPSLINVSVYTDSCAAAKNARGFTELPGDFNLDCKVTFIDFATMAGYWAACNNPLGSCL